MTHAQIFRNVDMAVGAARLCLQLDMIYGNTILRICETVEIELQEVSKTMAPLPHINLKTHYQM